MIATVTLSIFCIRFDGFEWLVAFTVGHEAWQLDELIVVLIFSGLAGFVLFARRTGELRREVTRRKAAEEKTAELARQAEATALAERLKLAVAAQANEQRLQTILAGAHQAIISIDHHGMITAWNGHAELIFGWSAEAVIGRRMSDVIIPPDFRAAHEAGLLRFMETRVARVTGTRIELEAVRRSGELFPVELSLSATNIGEEWQFTAMLHDISKRRAQNELSENAFDHAPIGMALVSLGGRLLKVNSAFCDLIGYQPDEAISLDLQTIIHPDDVARGADLMQQLVTGEIPRYQMEKRYIRKSGRIVWVRLSISSVLGDDGVAKHLISQIQDLSAERESEDRYRLLADSASDMVGLYSIDGRCSYMSPSSEKILGYTPDHLVGRTVFAFMARDDRGPIVQAIAELRAAAPGAVVTHQIRLRHEDGRLIPVEFTARIVAGEDGVPGVVSACRDVSARVAAQQALEQRTAELIDATAAAERSAMLVRDAEALFKGIFDSSSDVNSVYDMTDDGFILNTINEAAERVMGITASAARGKPLAALFPPTVASRVQQDLEEAVRLGEQRHTVEHRDPQGKDATFDIRLIPLRNEQGDIGRVFVSKRDITDLKHAEMAALRAIVLMRTAEKVAHMGYCTLDLATEEMTWSDEIWTILGLDRAHDAPTLVNLISRRHPDDKGTSAKTLSDAIATDAVDYENNYRLLMPSGEIRHVLTRGTIERHRGVAKSVFGVMMDISALKHAEQKARESDLRYRLMAENSSDVIVTSDLQGRTTFVSPASEAVTGYTLDDRLGGRVSDIVHPDDLDALRETFRALKNGEAVQRVRWRAWHKTEERWVWLESSPAMMRDPSTQAQTGYLDVIRDVTAQKEQEDALASARLSAEEAMLSKERFLANMSHELRTPLNSIIGFSHLLNESNGLPPEDQRRVGMVHSAGLALHAVVDNVLDFSKLEADKLALDCTPFDTAQFFNSTVALLEPQAAARDVRLLVDMDPQVPGHLIGDAGRLRQILLNLLSNAVKFTHEGSVRTNVQVIGCDNDVAQLRVEVVDTGGGIPQDKLPTLFNRFAQASASVSRHYGGTGLGLVISRQLVSLMGGKIGVSSDLGIGSTFWFELALPVANAQDAIKTDPSTGSQLSLVGKHILVVDDVDLNRELMLAMLARYGCKIALAENGERALAALAETPFDLILMDCQMPVMDGFAATRAIRRQPGPAAFLPIIALTASAQPEHLARCRVAGMDEHLTKPLDPRALEIVLRRYLGEADTGGRLLAAIDRRPVQTEPDIPIPEPKALPAPKPVGSLKERYAARRTVMLETLDAMVRAGQFTDVEISEVRTMAHNLAGTAGMFGEAALGEAAATLDAGLHHWHRDDRAERLRETAETMRRIASGHG